MSVLNLIKALIHLFSKFVRFLWSCSFNQWACETIFLCLRFVSVFLFHFNRIGNRLVKSPVPSSVLECLAETNEAIVGIRTLVCSCVLQWNMILWLNCACGCFSSFQFIYSTQITNCKVEEKLHHKHQNQKEKHASPAWILNKLQAANFPLTFNCWSRAKWIMISSNSLLHAVELVIEWANRELWW